MGMSASTSQCSGSNVQPDVLAHFASAARRVWSSGLTRYTVAGVNAVERCSTETGAGAADGAGSTALSESCNGAGEAPGKSAVSDNCKPMLAGPRWRLFPAISPVEGLAT